MEVSGDLRNVITSISCLPDSYQLPCASSFATSCYFLPPPPSLWWSRRDGFTSLVLTQASFEGDGSSPTRLFWQIRRDILPHVWKPLEPPAYPGSQVWIYRVSFCSCLIAEIILEQIEGDARSEDEPQHPDINVIQLPYAIGSVTIENDIFTSWVLIIVLVKWNIMKMDYWFPLEALIGRCSLSLTCKLFKPTFVVGLKFAGAK